MDTTVSDTSGEELAEVPTVVICNGDGAIEEGRELLRLAEALGVADRLCLVALNTRADAFETLPNAFHRIVLELPDERHHHHDAQVRWYLDDDDELTQVPGARRRRRLARYYVDNAENLAHVETKIRTIVREFVERFAEDHAIAGPEVVNVFQLVAGGGGTGSGVVPLMTAMIHTITQELEPVLGVGFYQWVAATLATVEEFHSAGRAPDIHWRYVANSLALLDELRGLTGEADVRYPLKIPLVGAEGAGLQRDSYQLSHNPLEGAFLVRYEEDRAVDNEDYRRGINHTVASAVLTWMRQDADGLGIENETDKLDDTFMELRATTFTTPIEPVSDLLSARSAAEQARKELSDKRERKAELAVATEQLQAVLGAKTAFQTHEHDGDEDVPDPVATALERCWTVSSNVDMAGLGEGDVDEWLAELAGGREFSFHEALDADRLLETVFLAALETRAERALADHPFKREIDEFVSDHYEAVTDFVPTFDDDAAVTAQWADAVEPLLAEQLEQVRAELDGLSLKERTDRSRVNRLKSSLASTKERLERYEALAAKHERLVSTAGRLSERRADCEESLTAWRKDLDERREELHDGIRTLEQQLSAAEDAIERHSEAARSASMGRFVTLPVDDDAQVSAQLVENDSGIAALVEQGVLDRETVTNLLRKTLRGTDTDHLENQLESRPVERGRAPARGTPYLFCDEQTRELLWQQAPGTPPAVIADNAFHGDPRTVRSTDVTQATLLVVYRNLCLDAFDHGELRNSFERGQPELFGEPVDLADCYAYPELIPPSHPARDDGDGERVSALPSEVDD